jgi:hypothetical protein
MANGSREYRTLTATKRLPPGPGPAGSLRVLAGLHRDPTTVMTGLRARHGAPTFVMYRDPWLFGGGTR